MSATSPRPVSAASSSEVTSELARALKSLPFCAIRTAPRPVDHGGRPPLDQFMGQRRAALTSSFFAQADGSVAVLWLRMDSAGPVSVMVGGRQLLGASAQRALRVPVMYPPGAAGDAVEGLSVYGLLAGVSGWTRIGVVDALRGYGDHGLADERHGFPESLEDALGSIWPSPYAVFVYAVPLAPGQIVQESKGVQRELQGLGHVAGPEQDLERERLERRYRELRRGARTGLWSVTILAGSSDARSSQQVAGLVAATLDVAEQPYVLVPLATFGTANEAFDDIDRGRERSESQGDLLGWVTTDLVAAVARLPIQEIPGIRLVERPTFDVTPDVEGDVLLGEILDHELTTAGDFSVSLKTLNRHAFVCGATGAGKSQTVRGLLESLSRRKPPVPWLVIEPAKAEYARMAGRLTGVSDVIVVTPGEASVPPGSLNPLEPASLRTDGAQETFPLQSHADLVRALFLAAFQAEEPFPQVLSRALTTCYQRAGWDLVTGDPLLEWDRRTGQPSTASLTDAGAPRYPALQNLQDAAFEVVGQIGYDEDIKKRVRGFVDVRIGSLRLGTPGRFFEGGHPIDFHALLRSNVVFEIEKVTNDQDKAFVIGAVLVRLYEQLWLEARMRDDSRGPAVPLRHVTVVEEAHRLLRRLTDSSPASHSIELFASLLAEVRAYGEGVMIAEQIPSKIISDAIKNTALKIVHRLPAADDREAVGATMNLTDTQSRYVVTLEPGVAAVFADGMDRPILVQMPLGERKESDELASRLPPLRGRRSRACGDQCQNGPPCALAQMRRAEYLLESDPILTFWVEIACAMHGLGLPAPGFRDVPSLRKLTSIAQSDPRLIECAIAHATEAAVSSRYSGLKEFFDPDALGEHLASVATDSVVNGSIGTACAEDRGRWRVGLQRFADVVASLKDPIRGPDPISESSAIKRARERGLELEEAAPSDLLAYLGSLRWSRYAGERQRSLLVGDGDPPRAITAAVKLAPPGGLREQFASALDLLVLPEPAEALRLLKVFILPQGAGPVAQGTT